MNQHKTDYTKINENKRFANQDILEETIEELQLDPTLVEEVILANSKFVRSVIETGAYESITLPYLGKLKAKLRSVQMAAGNTKRQ